MKRVLATAGMVSLGFLISIGEGRSAFAATDTEPFWAWAFTGPATSEPTAPSPPAVARHLDNTIRHTLPDSPVSFTEAEVTNVGRYRPVDWYPQDHPEPVPDIVAYGKESEGIYPCAICHRMNGNGRPENAAITGLSYEYFMQQLMDFKNGLRQTSDPRKTNTAKMAGFIKLLSDDELRAAATYFTAIPAKPWIKVIETDSVPKTVNRNDSWDVVKGADAGIEPLGQRIIETPMSEDAEKWKNPRSGFIAYVPRGSVKKGEALVTTGVTTSGAKITPCTVCHGTDLRGLGPVPRLAGRSASYIARQLYDMQHGNRAGPWSVLMAPVLGNLDADDLLVASAYLASLEP
jgi:cytochrome c553